MRTEVEAIYEDGVFRPVEPIELPERLRVIIQLPAPEETTPPTETEEEEPEPFWRGVSPVEITNEVLGTFPVQINISELPKMKPSVELNPTWFEDDD